MSLDLPTVWAGIVAFAVLAYVILDGFDLGVGIVFGLLDDDGQRDVAMNSVAPLWDGNETWLVLGAGGLFAAFPLVYATVLPALYAPMIAMLVGLVFRGVSFEFRWRTRRGRFLWDWGFAGGSLVAAFAQGIAIGALVQGIEIAERRHAGGWWDWLTPFSLLTGVALVVGYALLGATWLVMKTDGALQERSRRLARPLAFALLGLIGAVSLATPFLDPAYLERWFGWPTAVFSLVVPALVAGCWWTPVKYLRAKHDTRPFLASLGLFLLCYAGICISFYPYPVPPHITLHDAAAPDSSLGFLLIGTAVLIPVILGHTGYAYWVFRGKVDPQAGYH